MKMLILRTIMINRQEAMHGNVLHIMRNYYHKGATILHIHNILKIHLITQKKRFLQS